MAKHIPTAPTRGEMEDSINGAATRQWAGLTSSHGEKRTKAGLSWSTGKGGEEVTQMLPKHVGMILDRVGPPGTLFASNAASSQKGRFFLSKW